LPRVPDFANQVKIHFSVNNVVGISRTFGHDLSAWIAKITLSVKLTDPPRVFKAWSIDRADEVLIGNGVGRLFELP